jgi:hypothetical protein
LASYSIIPLRAGRTSSLSYLVHKDIFGRNPPYSRAAAVVQNTEQGEKATTIIAKLNYLRLQFPHIDTNKMPCVHVH